LRGAGGVLQFSINGRAVENNFESKKISIKKQMNKINTLGELKKSGYQSKSIKDELRYNLREKIKSGQPTFEGVHGFENTVIL